MEQALTTNNMRQNQNRVPAERTRFWKEEGGSEVQFSPKGGNGTARASSDAEKINGFQITGISLSGFKSFCEPAEMTFGNPTVITGGNGRGKSSIADAIAFAITGVPFFGEKKIDRMHSDDNPNLYVSLRLVDDKGVNHELVRTRKGGRTTVNFDGYEVRQLDLTDMFGEKDVFLSIFNPLYFIEELGEDGKNLLQRHLPMIPAETVLAELSDTTRALLKMEELSAPEAHVKRLREEIRQLERDVIYLQGQQDLAETQRASELEKKNLLQAKLTMLREEVQTLEAKRFAGINREELESKLTDLSAQYSDMAHDAGTPASDESAKVILALTQRLAEKKASVYESKFTQGIAEASERVRALAQRYNAEARAGNAIAPGFVCPTCRRKVSQEDLPSVHDAFRDSLNGILSEGKEQKAQLEQLKEMDAQSRETFEQFKAEDVARLEAELKAAVDKNGEVTEAENHAMLQRQTQAEAIRVEMQSISSDLEYGRLSSEEYERLKACKEEMRQTETELSILQTPEFPSAQEFESRIGKAQEESTAIKRRVDSLLQFISKRVELTFAGLRMNRVAISLYDVVKTTGEVKDVFKFEYNGRRYDRLSLSEKIRAGMEISELMKQLTGRNYPVFVDNMESVDDLNNVRPTGQVLMAKCVSGTELNIRPVKPILTEMPTAA